MNTESFGPITAQTTDEQLAERAGRGDRLAQKEQRFRKVTGSIDMFLGNRDASTGRPKQKEETDE